MSENPELFRSNFDFVAAITETRNIGYCFADDVLSERMRLALQGEIDNLPLELGDHRKDAINAGKPNEVHQQHERFYVEFGNGQTPVANTVIRGLATRVQAMRQFPELRNWQPTEIGYQRYRSVSDYIGPHRDRTTDKLLSVTFTIAGAAIVRTFESIKGEEDYSQLRPIDQHEVSAGGLMLLRAPGFGPAGQTVHEVLPPHTAPRSILNLRMRPNVLAQPSRRK